MPRSTYCLVYAMSEGSSASYTRAYLHHLIRSGEILGAMLLTEHNLWFYQQLMAAMRAARPIAGLSSMPTHLTMISSPSLQRSSTRSTR